MKNILIAILLLSSKNILAQKGENTYFNKRIHVGIKGGTNLVRFDGKRWEDGFRYGFHAGGFVQLKLIGKLSLQGEALFSQLVADTAKDFTDVVDYIRFAESRKTIKLNYLDIPVMVNIGIGPIKALQLQLGVQYGLLLNKNETLLTNGQQAFKSGQLSALGGVKLQFGPLNIMGRYLLGLDNINNVTNKNKWKSQTAQFSLGITI